MKASILDLRYRTKDILKSLDRGESVILLYHGKPKGTIHPWKRDSKKNMREHPFFGMNKKEKESVEQVMDKLRGPRYSDL